MLVFISGATGLLRRRRCVIAAGRRVKELRYCAALAVRRSVPGANAWPRARPERKYWVFQIRADLSRRSWLARKRVKDQMDEKAKSCGQAHSVSAALSKLIIATLDGFPVVDDDSRGAGSAARPPAKALGPFLGQPGAVRARALPIKRSASRKPPHIAPVEAHVAETAAAAQREGGRTRKTAARRHQAALSTFSTSDGGRGRRRDFPRRREIPVMLRFNEEPPHPDQEGGGARRTGLSQLLDGLAKEPIDMQYLHD